MNFKASSEKVSKSEPPTIAREGVYTGVRRVVVYGCARTGKIVFFTMAAHF